MMQAETVSYGFISCSRLIWHARNPVGSTAAAFKEHTVHCRCVALGQRDQMLRGQSLIKVLSV
jgi:hypothetical protein